MRLQVTMGCVLAIASAASAHADSPGAWVCDGFEESSIAARTDRLARFSAAIDAPLTSIDPVDKECVSMNLNSIEQARRSYCESRARLGHDLALNALHDLSHQIWLVSSGCGSVRRDAEIAALEEVYPKTCDGLLSSFLAFITFSESSSQRTPELTMCLRSAAPTLSPPLVVACEERSLSLRAAYVELSERVGTECRRSLGP